MNLSEGQIIQIAEESRAKAMKRLRVEAMSHAELVEEVLDLESQVEWFQENASW